MPQVVAIDIAILPPVALALEAVRLSRALPADQSLGLVLGEDRLPHVTLSQHFVESGAIPAAAAAVAGALAGRPPLPLHIAGAVRGTGSVAMSVEPTDGLRRLHDRLMAALEPFERPEGGADAFVDGDARSGDVAWVRGFRRGASGALYAPHITLGHASFAPVVAPSTHVADRVALCRLGRFCTCRSILAEWRLA